MTTAYNVASGVTIQHRAVPQVVIAWQALNQIMIEAYKKYVLVSLIVNGEVCRSPHRSPIPGSIPVHPVGPNLCTHSTYLALGIRSLP
jgi:hypothetical protein